MKLGSLSEDLLKLAVIFMQDPKLAASDAEELLWQLLGNGNEWDMKSYIYLIYDVYIYICIYL